MTLAEFVPGRRAGSIDEPVRLALDCLPDPSLVANGSDRIAFANKAYERLTGFASAEVEGKALTALLQPGPGDGALATTKSGVPKPVRLTSKPMAGQLVGQYRLVRLDEDDTRRSFVEELSAGLDIKGEFLARVSHELRTPLTAMQEGIDIVLDGLTGPLNPRQVEFLELARRNIQRITRLLRDYLELGSLKRGERLRPFQAVDLDRVLRECAGQWEDAEYAPTRPVWVEMDEPLVRDAIDRLVQNAIRHSGSEVCLALTSERGVATVAVADFGPGIPPDKLETIFEEFEQLSIGHGRTVGGVGLGLPIVKLIIELHGGRVWAESEPGRGACFCFALKTTTPPVEESS